jgi:hypothetical protein
MRAKTEIDAHSRPRATGTQAQRRCPRRATDSARATRLVTAMVARAATPRRTNAARAQDLLGRSDRRPGA